MRLDPPLRTTSPSPPAQEQELVQLTDALIEAVRQGRIPDREALLARYPQHAERLDGLIQAAEMVVDLRASSGSNGSALDLSDASTESEIPKQLGDFEILREIGKGGMGVVYEARQISLQRRVALKILPFASVLDSRQLQRFKNESLAAAQLNHPHIVDVYGVGCERGVHYYAMRLIEGQSLSEILAHLRRADQSERDTETDRRLPHKPEAQARDNGQRPDAPAKDGKHEPEASARATQPTPSLALRASVAETPVLAALSTDRARRTEFFRTVARIGIEAAEALHHAHEQGVIHRDVKPSNLLIDGRGRVWVADFGLAHIETGAELTLSGELMGTLRYMSPEQASGQRLGIDHRTDVYSLGVTLYELLTLRAPFEAPTRSELLRQILFDEPRPPRKLRKDVPVDLETIVLKCLEKSAGDRYASAGEVAEDLRRHLEEKEIAARRSGVSRRIVKWGRRHRPIVAGVAAALLAVAAIGGWVTWQQVKQQRYTTKLVNETLQEAAIREGEARAKGNDLAAWLHAVESARRAESLASAGSSNANLCALVAVRLAELQHEHDAVRTRLAEEEKDRQMVAALDTARLERAAVKDRHFDATATDTAYLLAFQQYGIDVRSLSVSQSAGLIRASRLHAELVQALLAWRYVATNEVDPRHGPDRAKLQALAEATVDGLPVWHRGLLALEPGDAGDLVDPLLVSAADLPPQAIDILARAMVNDPRQGLESAIGLLRAAQQQHPGDFWLNHDLGLRLLDARSSNPQGVEDAVRFLAIAVTLRPVSPGVWLNFGLALESAGREVEAIAAYHRALELQPDFPEAYNNLGNALKATGDPVGAIAAYYRALKLDPNLFESRANLGNAFKESGDLEAAIAAHHQALELRPDSAAVYNNLGTALRESGELPGAIAAFQRAMELKPDLPEAHYNLGIALEKSGDPKEAIAAWKQALELRDNYPEAHQKVGNALQDAGDLRGAIASYHRALELNPELPETHGRLGDALQETGDVEGAIAAYHRALELQPKFPEVYNNLGNALTATGDSDGAIAAYRRALELNPELSEAHGSLGNALRKSGDLKGAIAAYCHAIKLSPTDPNAHYCLGVALCESGDATGAIAAYHHALELQPDFPEARNNLGVALKDSGNLQGAIAAYHCALELRPDLAEAHYNLGNALEETGDREGAIAAWRRALELRPDNPEGHCKVGNALQSAGDLQGAIAAYQRALEIWPGYSVAHYNLGIALEQSGDRKGAIAAWQRALELRPDYPEAYCNLGLALQESGDVQGAIAAFQRTLKLRPDIPEFHLNLGLALVASGDLVGAIAAGQRALELRSDYSEAHDFLGTVLWKSGDLKGAIAAFHRSLELRPEDPRPQTNMGLALLQSGDFAGGLAALRRGHELGSRKSNWPYPTAHWVHEAERLVELDRRLTDFLAGSWEHADAAERVGLAHFALVHKRLPLTAAPLYRDALAGDASLGTDVANGNRYNAACAALLASVETGQTAEPLTEADRNAWRIKALDWLRADLAAWRQIADSTPDTRPQVAQTLAHWREDPDLASIRDAERLVQLPDAERQQWEQLWRDVDELQKSLAAE